MDSLATKIADQVKGFSLDKLQDDFDKFSRSFKTYISLPTDEGAADREFSKRVVIADALSPDDVVEANSDTPAVPQSPVVDTATTTYQRTVRFFIDRFALSVFCIDPFNSTLKTRATLSCQIEELLCFDGDSLCHQTQTLFISLYDHLHLRGPPFSAMYGVCQQGCKI